MALREFGAEIAGKSFYCIFPVRLRDSASPVMQRDIDKIIDHLKLSFYAERSPPPQVVQQELFMAAEESGEYFWKHPGLLFVDLWGVVYFIAIGLAYCLDLVTFELDILSAISSFRDVSKWK